MDARSYAQIDIPGPQMRGTGGTRRTLMLKCSSMSENTSAGFGCLFLLGLVGWGGYAAYNAIQDSGWASHTQAVDVYMKGDWLVGENRECQGLQNIPMKGEQTTGIIALYCPLDFYSDTPHNISIKFFGKTVRPELSIAPYTTNPQPHFQWRCSRSSEGFTCRALN